MNSDPSQLLPPLLPGGPQDGRPPDTEYTEPWSEPSPWIDRPRRCALTAAGNPSHLLLTLGTEAGILVRETPKATVVTGRPCSRATAVARRSCSCSYCSKALMEGSRTARKPSRFELFFLLAFLLALAGQVGDR